MITMLLYLQVLGEVEEVVKTGCWVGDCFIYTNSVNRLNYYVGGELVTIGENYKLFCDSRIINHADLRLLLHLSCIVSRWFSEMTQD